MSSEAELRDALEAIARNEFRLSERDDLSSLLAEMLTHIGSTDRYLRDELIYTTFATWILEQHALEAAELRDLLQLALSDRQMFYRIGERGSDSVFRRSFSVLLLPLLLIAHRSQPFLSWEQVTTFADPIEQSLRRLNPYARPDEE